MYSQITDVGRLLVTFESIVLVIGLFHLFKGLHHWGLMVRTARPLNISGEFPATFALHKEKAVHFMTIWMLFVMLACLVGAAFIIADGMSLIHLTESVPMNMG